ncbi:hypothetical protein K461DRAFT_288955 [Myriangium duriaei CBS 260.36]|uniref:Uncharacterized protein n=1 Tax=Myriangium duriaei CBS 260.36 TaxID=1168546 RepID=A0A9P4MRG9_9PEZI|nr:hypothetical protein K461DRAFT_288955 [Myriangium duriaei CBS 260.36]
MPTWQKSSSLMRHLRELPPELRTEIYKRIWQEHDWIELKKNCECYVYPGRPSHSSFQIVDMVDFTSYTSRIQNFTAIQYSVLPYDLSRPLHSAFQVEDLPHDLGSEYIDAIRGKFVLEIRESYYMDSLTKDIDQLIRANPSRKFALNVAIVFDEFTLNWPQRSGLEYLMSAAVRLPEDFRLFLRLGNANSWLDYEVLNNISVDTGFSKRVAGISVNMQSFPSTLKSRFADCEIFHEQQLLAAVYDVTPPVHEFLNHPSNREDLAMLSFRGFHGTETFRSNTRSRAVFSA